MPAGRVLVRLSEEGDPSKASPYAPHRSSTAAPWARRTSLHSSAAPWASRTSRRSSVAPWASGRGGRRGEVDASAPQPATAPPIRRRAYGGAETAARHGSDDDGHFYGCGDGELLAGPTG
ncbi:hypothetical protein EJB05_36909, partial [Eragrostis curvula]